MVAPRARVDARFVCVGGCYGISIMERRQHPRSDAAIHVRIESAGRTYRGLVRDISTRGIFVEVDAARGEAARGAARLHFEIDTGTQVLSRQVSGTIIRAEHKGLAVRFADHDVLGRAVVHELLYYMQVCCGTSLPAGGCTHDHLDGLSADEYAA
jgi:hypothetical protein